MKVIKKAVKKEIDVKSKLREIAIVITAGLKAEKQHTGKVPESFFKFGVWFVENTSLAYHEDLTKIEEAIGEVAIREWLRDVLAASGVYKQVGEDELEVA